MFKWKTYPIQKWKGQNIFSPQITSERFSDSGAFPFVTNFCVTLDILTLTLRAVLRFSHFSFGLVSVEETNFSPSLFVAVTVFGMGMSSWQCSVRRSCYKYKRETYMRSSHSLLPVFWNLNRYCLTETSTTAMFCKPHQISANTFETSMQYIFQTYSRYILNIYGCKINGFKNHLNCSPLNTKLMDRLNYHIYPLV